MSVRSELTPRVQAMALLLGIPVAYENVAFTKPSNLGTFLEMIIVPAVTMDVATIGTRQREMGYMQLNLWIKQGIGTALETTIINAVKTTFPLVPKTGLVSIEATPSIKAAILDNSGYRVIPIVIPYRLEVQI